MGVSLRRAMSSPHWGFYFAATGDLIRLHQYLVNPNTPTLLKTPAAYCNVQLDQASDCMPPLSDGGDPNAFSVFEKNLDDSGLYWTHIQDRWIGVLGDSCLHLAVRQKHFKAVRLLLKHGNQETAATKNSRGQTPADVAAEVGLEWPLPPAEIDVKLSGPKLIKERSSRGCSISVTLFGSSMHWRYKLLTSFKGGKTVPVWRRYSDFKKLWECLVSQGLAGADDQVAMPGLWEELMFDAQCQEHLFAREKSLDFLVQQLAFSSELCQVPEFVQFLGGDAPSSSIAFTNYSEELEEQSARDEFKVLGAQAEDFE